jgi:hypothetical protein
MFNGNMDAGNLLLQREDVHLSNQLIESKEVEIKVSRQKRSRLSIVISGSTINRNSMMQIKLLTVPIGTKVHRWNQCQHLLIRWLSQEEPSECSAITASSIKFQNEQTKQQANTEWLTASEMLRKDQQQYEITISKSLPGKRVFTSRKALYAEGVSNAC